MSENLYVEHHPYRAQSQELINGEVDTLTKAKLIVAALEEGAPYSADELLSVTTQSDASLDTRKHVNHTLQQAVDALGAHQHFAHADLIVYTLLNEDPEAYMYSVSSLLKHGHAGYDNEYRRFSRQTIEELAIAKGEQLPHGNDPLALAFRKIAYITQYLKGAAAYGESIYSPDSPSLDVFFALGDLRNEHEHMPDIVDLANYEISLAHAQAGHLDLAVEGLISVRRPYYAGMLCTEIATRTEDESLVIEMLAQATQLITNNADALSSIDMRQIRLRGTYAGLQKNIVSLPEAVKQLGRLEAYLPEEQLKIYGELYRQTGSRETRNSGLALLKHFHESSHRDTYLKAVENIATNDAKWHNFASADQRLPLVAAQVAQIFPAMECASSAQNHNEVSQVSVWTQPQDSHLATALVRQFGIGIGEVNEHTVEDAIPKAMTQCHLRHQETLGRLAGWLAKRNEHAAAKQLLDQITSKVERVRALEYCAWQSA